MRSVPSDPGFSALLTDFYQLTMLKSYYELGMTGEATFEFFFRRMSDRRNVLVCAGLEPALAFLETLRFTEADLAWLGSDGGFESGFVDRLRSLRFTGTVEAMPEGTLVFPDEPLLRIVAPLPEAQLVESRLVALLHYSTIVASKAARCVLAAPGRTLFDFGLRRAHGAEAGLLAARSSYIAGFSGTATVLAGAQYGLPVFGTMAHSFVLAHDSEAEAFLNFARGHPGNTTLLIDTYDTDAAAGKLVDLMPKLRAEGLRVNAVRIDSGDLGVHAMRVRRILDDGGCSEVRIIASGGLDEYSLAELARAPIDGFGVGTSLATVSDAPSADCAYKLQEYLGQPRRKRSEGKANWPGRKQVFRRTAPDGSIAQDTIALVDETLPGMPLLVPVMAGGVRLHAAEPLDAIRARTARSLQALPAPLRSLAQAPTPYPVQVSDGVRALALAADRSLR
jgi:nicotinate phosphoribosyltransferase